MTKVYTFKINQDFKKSYNFYLNDIPLNLKENIIKFRNISDQYRSLVGKLLIRFALFKEGFDHDVLLKCKRDIYNRPYINNQIDFNISHSGDYVICAITDKGTLGVDIEKMESIEIKDFLFLFTDSEIKGIDNRLDMFYLLWTQKEALSKAIGKGLGVNLKDIIIKNGTGFFEADSWNLKSIDIDKNYMSHLAYKENCNPKFLKVDNSDLMIR